MRENGSARPLVGHDVEQRREKGGGLIVAKSSFRRAFNGSWMENLTMSYNELKLNSVSNRK